MSRETDENAVYMDRARELLGRLSEKKGEPLSFCVVTFGC